MARGAPTHPKFFIIRLNMCSILASRVSFGPANSTLIKCIHTSQPRRVLDVLTLVSAGHYLQSVWPNIGFYYKCVAAAAPSVAVGYFTTHCLLRYKYDYLLKRKKLALTPKFGYKAALSLRPMLGGPPVVAVNKLLGEVIDANSMEFAVKDPIYQWQVFVFEKAEDWYNLNEGGQMFLSKDILLTLSKNELTAFMSIQMAHIMAKHATEINSYSVVTSYSMSFLLGMYAFFVPRAINFPADLGILVALHYTAGYTISQLKFRSILTEADQLALRLAKNCQVNENDFISLFEKLKQARKRLNLLQRVTTYCFYDHRIQKLQSYLEHGKQQAS